MTYWIALANSINTYCDENRINYINFFYHEKLVREKLEKPIQETPTPDCCATDILDDQLS